MGNFEIEETETGIRITEKQFHGNTHQVWVRKVGDRHYEIGVYDIEGSDVESVFITKKAFLALLPRLKSWVSERDEKKSQEPRTCGRPQPRTAEAGSPRHKIED